MNEETMVYRFIHDPVVSAIGWLAVVVILSLVVMYIVHHL
jgi:hypothetical protein